MRLTINWYVTSGLGNDWHLECPTLTFMDEQWISRGIGAHGRFYSFDESPFKLTDRFEFL